MSSFMTSTSPVWTPTRGSCLPCRAGSGSGDVPGTRASGHAVSFLNVTDAAVEAHLNSRSRYGFRKILWSPSRRQRTAGCCDPSESATVVHSHVARPSGPLKLHVISMMPGALTTGFTRRRAGHDPGSLLSMKTSHASLNA